MRAALSHPRAGACCGGCSTSGSVVGGVRAPAHQPGCGVGGVGGSGGGVGLRCLGLGGRARGYRVSAGAADNDGGSVGDDEAPATSQNALERTIKRKSEQVQSLLLEMGEEALEDRLQGSLQVPTNPPYRLATLIADSVTQGRTVLVYEVGRSSPSQTATDLANLAKQYVAMGADAICVRIDSDDTPTGLKDLFMVAQSVKVPVIARDYLIHPLQVVEIKESGASGCLGVIGQVNGRGTAVLSSFSAALGLDAPVEVVNLREVDGLAKAGVVFYAMNISVGISVALPGFGADLAHGILGNLPFGAISMVGVKSLEEAVKAKASGADSILVKHECIEQYKDNMQFLTMQLAYAASGDD